MKISFKRIIGFALAALTLTAIFPMTISAEALMPSDSPDYIKTADGKLELLYNDTITENGKKYIGFTIARDYAGIDGIAGIELNKAAVDYDGNAVTEPNMAHLSLIDNSHQKIGEFEQTLIPALPRVVQENLLMYKYSIGNFGMLPGQNYAAAPSYNKAKLTFVSKDILDKHKEYLKEMILDNTFDGTDEDKVALAFTSATPYRLWNYNAKSGIWAEGMQQRPLRGSIFPMFYVSTDVFKSLKFDVSSMGENVKLIFTSDYAAGDFGGLYTDEELKSIGIKSFKTFDKPETFDGAKFTADGNKYILTDSIREIDGKKYLGVLSASAKGFWAHNRMFLKYDEETINNSEKLVKIVHGTKDQFDGNIKDIQDYISDFSAFSGYLAPPDTKWEMYRGTPDGGVYENQSIIINAVGTVGLPSKNELQKIMEHDTLAVKDGTAGIANSTLGFYNKNFFMGSVSGSNVTINSDNSFLKEENYKDWYYTGSTYYIMTYVSEDFFKNVGIDMALTGEYAKEILRNNFTYDDLQDWSLQNKTILYGISYTGEGAGITASKKSIGNNLLVNVSISNNGTETIEADSLLIVVVFDGDRLMKIKTLLTDSALDGGKCTTIIPITVENVLPDASVKVMLWDSLSGLTPLAVSTQAN